MGFIDGMKELGKMFEEKEAEKEDRTDLFTDEGRKKFISNNIGAFIFFILLFVGMGVLGIFGHFQDKERGGKRATFELMIQNKDYDEALNEVRKLSRYDSQKESYASTLMDALLVDGETDKAKSLFLWACTAGAKSASEDVPLSNAVILQVSLVSYLNSKGLTEDAKNIQSIDCTRKKD